METRNEMAPDVRLENVGELRFRMSFASGAPPLTTDAPPPHGTAAGPDPTALLAAAIGDCLASSLLHCARKSRIDPEGLTGDVALERVRDEQGRLRVGRVRVRLAPRVKAEERKRLGRCLELFESFCVVTESVRHGIPVDVLVEPAATQLELAVG